MLKSMSPSILFNRLKNKGRLGWTGNYNTWREAQLATTGYDDNEILNKVKNSLLMVKKGEAIYERDSVLFDEIQYSWPLLSGLMLASNPKLSVLDFGGSLGSTYFQNKKFLSELNDFKWGVVEQKQFVDVGKKDFEDKHLTFYLTVQDCIEALQPNVILLSSVLQYIEKPYALLDELLSYDIDYIIIDRTSFGSCKKDIIKIQTVPETIYKASYPCWFFHEEKLTHYLEQKYRLIEDFNGADQSGKDYYFKGMIWRRND